MKKRKQYICILVVLLMTLFCTQISFAHSSNQSSTITWGESIGWDIDESNHTNSKSLSYKFDSTDTDLTTAIKTIVKNGASKWSSYGTISESSSGTGTVYTFSDSNTDEVAGFCQYSSNSSGHLTTWKIEINRYYSATSVTIAHEFGHAYGLNDLYESQNISKLMYGIESRTVTSPTSSDGKGFKVITGVHTTHTWKYKQVPNYPSNVPMHRKYCSVCDGYKDEGCTPTSGTCSYCKYYH